uniref:BTB domain-containing protein n=1 Tax=Panagrolaimus davidi TaxID=227884 RepID=A0A914QFJ4_9BILA
MHLKDPATGFLHGKCFYCPKFPGLQYSLIFFPHRHGLSRAALYVNGSKERKIKAEFSISVEAADFFRDFDCIYETSKFHGTCFGKTLDFFDAKNKFFVNGEITIKVKGIFIAPRPLIAKILNEESYKGRLRSKCINIAKFNNAKYHLQIRPSVIRESGIEAQTELFLYVEMGDETKIEAAFDISIDSANYNHGNNFVYEKAYGRGTSLCSTADLLDPSKRFIDNGYLTINLNGILMKQKKQFITLNYKRCLAPKCFSKNGDKDFLIIVNDKEVQVHKKLIINVSPVFAGIFQSGMKESIENKIVIIDFPFKIVEAAIKLLYGDRGTCKFVLENLLKLYLFSDKYRIQFISDLVENHLIKHISQTNVVQLSQFSASDSFNIKKLHQSRIKFLIKCFKEEIPIYASENLDKNLVFNIFTNGFRPIFINEL